MEPKGEVNYIAVKQRKPILFWHFAVITACTITALAVVTIRLYVEIFKLDRENKELTKIIEMKNSMITDLQEDNMKLQEMIDND